MKQTTGAKKMVIEELKKLISSGDVGSVVFYYAKDAKAWEIWAYDHWLSSDDEKNPTTVAAFGNRLTGGRSKAPKTYTSIDRAYEAIKALGWSKKVTIEG
jgi:hypothetical protein